MLNMERYFFFLLHVSVKRAIILSLPIYLFLYMTWLQAQIFQFHFLHIYLYETCSWTHLRSPNFLKHVLFKGIYLLFSFLCKSHLKSIILVYSNTQSFVKNLIILYLGFKRIYILSFQKKLKLFFLFPTFSQDLWIL